MLPPSEFVSVHLPRLPKIDLHRHLEGALRLETLVEIAQEYDLDAPRTLDALRPLVQVMPGDVRTPDMFLSKFTTLRKFFCSEAVIRRMAREVVADAAADHVVYLELRFTPQALSNLLRVDFPTVVAWMCDAVSEAEAEYGTLVRLIVSMNRHESVEIGERVLDAALTRRGCGVVGIDLAGREADFPAAPFTSVLERARREGLGVTVHAGEWAGAVRVREAVLDLNAGRIGHGVRAAEDPAVLDLLLERGVTLEVCPSSNVDSGVCPSLAAHQLPHLLAAGVRATLNTDDPLISGITLTDEMARAVLGIGLTPLDLKTMTFHAARAAFLTDAERSALLARLDAGWQGVT